MKIEGAAGEEGFYLGGTDAAGLRIGGVEPEVVPEDEAAGQEHTQHFGSKAGFEGVIEDGGEYGELEDEIEGGGGIGKVTAIGDGEGQVGEAVMGVFDPVGEQVGAVETSGLGTQAEELLEHPAAATAELEDVLAVEAAEAVLFEEGDDCTLPLLVNEESGFVEGGIDVAAGETTLAVGVFGSQAGEISLLWIHILWKKRSIGGLCRVCRPSGSKI